MSRLAFLLSLLGLTAKPDPCTSMLKRVRRRLVLASGEDNCGGSNDYANGYRQSPKDVLDWWDRGMPEGFDER